MDHNRELFKYLAPFTTFGAGSFGMSALKKMTGTKSFEKLPDQQKKCSDHNRVECQTQKHLEAVHTQCNCTPWALHAENDEDQVSSYFYSHIQFTGIHILWP